MATTIKTSRIFSALLPRKSIKESRCFFLDSNRAQAAQFGTLRTYTCKGLAGWSSVFADSTDNSMWICSQLEKAELLLRAALQNVRNRVHLGDLVLLQPPQVESIPPLQALFRRVVGSVRSFKMLPPDELFEALKSSEEESRNLFIGGSVDPVSETLTLTRGNLDTVVVPFSMFRPSGVATPDWGDFEVTGYGNTIRLGTFEASADGILYEVDAAYRKRLNQKRRAEEKGFGASLRRLRIQRRLGRGQFQSISAKTIARIERGETEKPRGKTLKTLADVLNVAPEQIESF